MSSGVNYRTRVKHAAEVTSHKASLMLAVSYDDLPIIRTLLKGGADPNAQHFDGDNAIETASQ